jgi:Asp-tRNA(Asn)/Glu-tRNA(Gln) amidotransferase A subunit family amidase
MAQDDWRGSLHGVPVTIEDHFAVKGMRTANAFPPRPISLPISIRL